LIWNRSSIELDWCSVLIDGSLVCGLWFLVISELNDVEPIRVLACELLLLGFDLDSLNFDFKKLGLFF